MATFVSDVLDIDKVVEEHGNRIFLIAGVGSGKSTWVKEVLTKKGSVLFITSRKAKVEEDIKCSCFSEVYDRFTNDNQTLITNAKLSAIVERMSDDYLSDLDEFIDHFKYIVIDEIHSLATDSTYADSSFGLGAFIEYAETKGNIIITMTGTPEPIQYYFEGNGWHIIDLRKICEYVKPTKVTCILKRFVIKKIEETISAGRKMVYFVNNTSTIIDVYDELLKKGILECQDMALCVARVRDEEIQKKVIEKIGENYKEYVEVACKEAYESIINQQLLPSECKLLLSTSALREGVDIKNENVDIICDNHILSNLVQFFGRIRTGGSQVYIVEDAAENKIKHNVLLFDYAVEEEIKAANSYLTNRIRVTGNAFVDIETKILINHVNNNPYIYYNYIKKQFELFAIKFLEEERLSNISDWKKELKNFCDKWGIEFPYVMSDEAIVKIKMKVLENLAIQGRKLYRKNKEHEIIINLVKEAYGITHRSCSKISELLESKGARVKVISDTDRTNEKNTYWQVKFIEDNE